MIRCTNHKDGDKEMKIDTGLEDQLIEPWARRRHKDRLREDGQKIKLFRFTDVLGCTPKVLDVVCEY